MPNDHLMGVAIHTFIPAAAMFCSAWKWVLGVRGQLRVHVIVPVVYQNSTRIIISHSQSWRLLCAPYPTYTD